MRTLTRSTLRSASLTAILASSLLIAACSSDDDGEEVNDNLVSVSIPLTEEETVNVTAGVPADATGTADITVDTLTGAVTGTATLSGLTGPATMAHIHEGIAGATGNVLINFVADDATGLAWTIEEDSTLDTAQIDAFLNNALYVNIHTEANGEGELRGQLVRSFTLTFTNTSESQPMTPPVVAMHTPADGAGVEIFSVGGPASDEVVAIAENGNNAPLVTQLEMLTADALSDFGVAAPDPAGPLLPGATSTITLTPTGANQVLSLVSMVVCTNDGFSGIDSMVLPTTETTMTVPIYDAGSETNIQTLNYWVQPCTDLSTADGDTPAVSDNISGGESADIALHTGQSTSENPVFNFDAGSELLQVVITPN